MLPISLHVPGFNKENKNKFLCLSQFLSRPDDFLAEKKIQNPSIQLPWCVQNKFISALDLFDKLRTCFLVTILQFKCFLSAISWSPGDRDRSVYAT